MSKSTTTLIIIFCLLAAYLITIKLSHSGGLSLDKLSQSDAQLAFDKELSLQKLVFDSLAKVYPGKYVTTATFTDNNRNIRNIYLYSNELGVKVIDTLIAGDTVQIKSIVPFKYYQPNVEVMTKKGETGYMIYFYVKEIEDILNQKGIETEVANNHN